MADKRDKKYKKMHIGNDGKIMTGWQIWLQRLCYILLGWAVFELAVGVLLLVSKQLVPAEIVAIWQQSIAFDLPDLWMSLGVSSTIGAVLNGVVALLGVRGAKNPCKIAIFFWVILASAVLVAWSLASSITQGAIDPIGLVSGLFIIALAVCSWQIRKQTGYFDHHPKPEKGAQDYENSESSSR